MDPFFSVIVPVYNVEEYLGECVESILSQGFSDFELILVDDGSPDNCPALCDGYAARDERVSVIHKKNAGLAQARKSGLLQARADYVCFIDSDDYVSPGWLQRLYDIFTQQHPDFVVYGYIRAYPAVTYYALDKVEPGLYDRARLEKEIFPYMMAGAPNGAYGEELLGAFLWNKPGLRSLYTEYYLKDDRIRTMEDAPMMYETLYHAQSVYFDDTTPYHYRVREGSILGTNRLSLLPPFRMAYDYLQAHLGMESDLFHHQTIRWLLRHVFGVILTECENGRPTAEVVRTLRKYYRQGRPLDGVPLKDEPLRVRFFMGLLKAHMYLPLVLSLKFLYRVVWKKQDEENASKEQAQQDELRKRASV